MIGPHHFHIPILFRRLIRHPLDDGTERDHILRFLHIVGMDLIQDRLRPLSGVGWTGRLRRLIRGLGVEIVAGVWARLAHERLLQQRHLEPRVERGILRVGIEADVIFTIQAPIGGRLRRVRHRGFDRGLASLVGGVGRLDGGFSLIRRRFVLGISLRAGRPGHDQGCAESRPTTPFVSHGSSLMSPWFHV